MPLPMPLPVVACPPAAPRGCLYPPPPEPQDWRLLGLACAANATNASNASSAASSSSSSVAALLEEAAGPAAECALPVPQHEWDGELVGALVSASGADGGGDGGYAGGLRLNASADLIVALNASGLAEDAAAEAYASEVAIEVVDSSGAQVADSPAPAVSTVGSSLEAIYTRALWAWRGAVSAAQPHTRKGGRFGRLH